MLTALTVAALTGVVGVLLGFAVGAAFGGRHAHAQSRRAGLAESRALVAERLAVLESADADAAHQQLATLRASLRRTAPRAVGR